MRLYTQNELLGFGEYLMSQTRHTYRFVKWNKLSEADKIDLYNGDLLLFLASPSLSDIIEYEKTLI